MFTGIVENLGEILSLQSEGTNLHITIKSSLAKELKVDQSVSHNGVCLTVVEVNELSYRVVAIQETLNKTNLSKWQMGSKVNLERCMPANGRFDGHIVQGHVDTVALCTSIADNEGSWTYTFKYDNIDHITVEKGSITVNGVSLTVVNSKEFEFQVAIIPYTYENTNFCNLIVGDYVNLEFDILGKYVKKILAR